MTAAERLEVGRVGERDLDLHEHVAGARLGPLDLLDSQVARAVQPRGLHGANATFSAAPER